MTDQSIEQQIQAKGLNAPRITPEAVQESIASEFFFTAQNGVIGANSAVNGPVEPALALLTFCVLVLRNGFTVTGESACASPANFDPEIGRKIARENAIAKVWPLLGFALKQKLHDAEE